MNGYIKMYRSLIEWEWYSDINTTRLFVHLLLTANYEDARFRGIAVKRGQKICTLDSLSQETSLTVSQIRCVIKRLYSTGEITDEIVRIGSTQNRLITLLNYEKYQSYEAPSTGETADERECQQQVNDRSTTGQTENLPIISKLKKNNKNNNIIIYTSCPEQISENCSELPEEAHEPQVTKINLKIPLKDGSRYEITGDDVERYAQLYPKIDVEQELRSLIGWNEANPTRRKTKGGIRNHINTWLAKAQRAATDTRTSYSHVSAPSPDSPASKSKFSLSDFDEALQGAYTCQTSP